MVNSLLTMAAQQLQDQALALICGRIASALNLSGVSLVKTLVKHDAPDGPGLRITATFNFVADEDGDNTLWLDHELVEVDTTKEFEVSKFTRTYAWAFYVMQEFPRKWRPSEPNSPEFKIEYRFTHVSDEDTTAYFEMHVYFTLVG